MPVEIDISYILFLSRVSIANKRSGTRYNFLNNMKDLWNISWVLIRCENEQLTLRPRTFIYYFTTNMNKLKVSINDKSEVNGIEVCK